MCQRLTSTVNVRTDCHLVYINLTGSDFGGFKLSNFHLHLPPWIRSSDMFRHRRIAIVSCGVFTISSSSRFVVEGVIRESGVVHSFKMVDPVLFVFESHVLYSRDLQFFTYDFASYFIQPCVSSNIS